jgi:hypothetical protein
MTRAHLVVLLVGTFASATFAAPDIKWAQKMQALKSAMQEALPDIASDRPLTPAETKRLQRAAKTMADLAHNIDTKASKPSTSPDSDPTLRFMSGMFSRQAAHANNLLNGGHTDAGRNVLRVLTGYCIGCHTRGDHGPEFPKMELSPKLNSLTPMEKADLFAATRQFEAAFDQYFAVVSDRGTAEKKQLQWGRAARRALMVSVRTLKDPLKAEKLLNQIVNAEGTSQSFVPEFFKSYVGSWKTAVEDWKNESTKKLNSESEILSEAKRLIAEGKKVQKYPMDSSADVQYLRASATLHELMIHYPTGAKTAEALYLQGQTYMVLDDPHLSPLPEMYYESCIRTSPHTSQAVTCFNAFEESVFVGFTGSGGTSIPTDVKKHMAELKTIALPAHN